MDIIRWKLLPGMGHARDSDGFVFFTSSFLEYFFEFNIKKYLIKFNIKLFIF